MIPETQNGRDRRAAVLTILGSGERSSRLWERCGRSDAATLTRVGPASAGNAELAAGARPAGSQGPRRAASARWHDRGLRSTHRHAAHRLYAPVRLPVSRWAPWRSWYVRPLIELGSEPVSLAFPTAKAAIDAVAEGRWRKEVRPSSSGGPLIRVIWPASVCPGHSATDLASRLQERPVY